jgi:hypothetical protein
MINHNFNVFGADTDSIIFCKLDQSPFSEEEQTNLINEINSILPEMIKFAHDGIFKSVVYLKAKNYILYDGKKLKIKGSALKSSTKELALKQFMNDIIQSIISEKYNYLEIYNSYIVRIFNIKDKEEMKLWSSKKTVTERTINSERTNETKVMAALNGENIQMGDKHYFYFTNVGTLSLSSNFNKDYDPFKLIEKLWRTIKTFESIIDIKQFPKYHLKTQRKLLANLGLEIQQAL